MAPRDLDERKRQILKVITDDYIASAEPVGSRTIARKYNLGLSPATIRNEMADLEEDGYLEQPHTSAGRIPSDLGYRYYVDALMEHRRLRPDEMASIHKELASRERVLGSVIHHAARVLAQFTHFPSLVLTPDRRKVLFKHVRLVKLSERNVLLLLVTDTGQVEHKVIEGDFALDEEELDRVSNVLNGLLINRPVSEAKTSLEQDARARTLNREQFFHQAMQTLIEGSQSETAEHVVMDGAAQILDQPEFTERERFRPLLRLLEQEEALYRLLVETHGSERLRVAIGQENKVEVIQDCSVVTATYQMNERSVGIIGVLGPTRMDYAKVLAVVEFMASNLSTILNELAGK